MIADSTICAISTPFGTGGIAVIRLSGERAIQIIDGVFQSPSKEKKITYQPANTLHFGSIIINGELLDEVVVSLFRSPNSYTGDDVVEISCHGSRSVQ